MIDEKRCCLSGPVSGKRTQNSFLCLTSSWFEEILNKLPITTEITAVTEIDSNSVNCVKLTHYNFLHVHSSSLENTKNKSSTYLSSIVGLFCCDAESLIYYVIRNTAANVEVMGDSIAIPHPLACRLMMDIAKSETFRNFSILNKAFPFLIKIKCVMVLALDLSE